MSRCMVGEKLLIRRLSKVIVCKWRLEKEREYLVEDKVLTYSVTYLGEVLGDVPSETWRLKPRLRGSLAQGCDCDCSKGCYCDCAKGCDSAATRAATVTTARGVTATRKTLEVQSAPRRACVPVCHHCGVRGHIRPKCFKLLREKHQMKQTYGMRFPNPACYCEAKGHVRRCGLNSGHRANHGGIRLMDTWSGRSGHYGDGGMSFYTRMAIIFILVFDHDVTQRGRLKMLLHA
ncbi:hypothetical protein F2Q70_00004880 [Brassica cretica]|uniref:CCHC-type domain-containing protein n=1 Tax=Brassica cretica TaxID=69181 RepID=A0A8S9ITW9_BRACR|nr:hypothetical protein F2Q70_00004880 [Brassica cretica]